MEYGGGKSDDRTRRIESNGAEARKIFSYRGIKEGTDRRRRRGEGEKGKAKCEMRNERDTSYWGSKM